MNDEIKQSLIEVARRYDTPSFVYMEPLIHDRVRRLARAFGDRFDINYAVKANPNTAILELFHQMGLGLDVSSVGEFVLGLRAGFDANRIGFTGPGKRRIELETAIGQGIGQIICESPDELEDVNRVASDLSVVQPVLVRINPSHVPSQFGLRMAGQPTQFGIDQEDVPALLSRMPDWPAVTLIGFHAFSAGNSLVEDAVVENLLSLIDLFTRLARDFRLKAQKFIFGSGFGIPYFEGDEELDLEAMALELNPAVDRVRATESFRDTSFELEMGRWLVGPAGYMLTSIVRCKTSRGRAICICDAGFNNNLSAAGMMGTVMRRDWRFWNLDSKCRDAHKEYLLAGPLCASFDVLGASVALPETKTGDILAVGSSGAYGLTASPMRFISHPEPKEYLVRKFDEANDIVDISR